MIGFLSGVILFGLFWIVIAHSRETPSSMGTVGSGLNTMIHYLESGRQRSVLYILTWKCASRHNGVHFFNISTAESGPNLVCFVHFDLGMCFAPQRHAIFNLSSGQLAPHPPL